MAYIEGDADHGFTITIDGPTSLFSPSTRYGLAIAKLIPALLHVTRWSLSATLQTRLTQTLGKLDASALILTVVWCPLPTR